MKENKLFLGLI